MTNPAVLAQLEELNKTREAGSNFLGVLYRQADSLIADARTLATLKPLLVEWARRYDRFDSADDDPLRAAIPEEWFA